MTDQYIKPSIIFLLRTVQYNIRRHFGDVTMMSNVQTWLDDIDKVIELLEKIDEQKAQEDIEKR